MFKTISVTELQKALSKTFQKTKAFKYVLANNKIVGLILSKKATDFLENSGMLQEMEDYLLANDESFNEARKEGQKVIEKGDYSQCLNFDELCKLN